MSDLFDQESPESLGWKLPEQKPRASILGGYSGRLSRPRLTQDDLRAMWEAGSPVEQATPEKGVLQSLKEGAVTGIERAGAGLSGMLGRRPEVIASDLADIKQYPQTAEEQAFDAETQVRAQAFDDAEGFRESASAALDILGLMAKNPKQAGKKIAESLGSSLPAFGGAAGGAAVGFGLGGPVGSVIGGLVGYVGGNLATNVQAEMAGKLESDMAERGIDTRDAAKVAEAIRAEPDLIGNARAYATKKGAATTAAETVVDVATLGAGKFLKPARSLLGKTGTAAGVMAGQGVAEGAGSMAGSAAVGEPVSVGQAITEGAYGAIAGAPEGAAIFHGGRHLGPRTPEEKGAAPAEDEVGDEDITGGSTPSPAPGTGPAAGSTMPARVPPTPADWEVVDDLPDTARGAPAQPGAGPEFAGWDRQLERGQPMLPGPEADPGRPGGPQPPSGGGGGGLTLGGPTQEQMARRAVSPDALARSIQPTDILSRFGTPFILRSSAEAEATRTGGQVVAVDDGFVVRPERGDAAAGRDGVDVGPALGADLPQPVPGVPGDMGAPARGERGIVRPGDVLHRGGLQPGAGAGAGTETAPAAGGVQPQAGTGAVGTQRRPTRAEVVARRKRTYADANPFKAFLAEHGVHTSERSDVGGERNRPVMVPYHGVLFRNSGLRLDELARLAAERGFLTQADIDSDLDNGGVNKLSDMIRRMLAGENIRPAAEMEADNEAEWQRQAEARWEAMAEAEQAIVDELTDNEISALLQIAANEDAEVRNEEIDHALGIEGSGTSEAGRGETQEGAARSEAGGDLAGGAEAGDESPGEITLTAPTRADIRRQQAIAEGTAAGEGAQRETRQRLDAEREAADRVGFLQPPPSGVDQVDTTGNVLARPRADLAPAEPERTDESLTQRAERALSKRGDGKDSFIPAPDGSLDYGEITPEMGRTMRRQAGKIRLQKGDATWGMEHIEARHGDEIRAAGFDSVEAFVSAIATNIDRIMQPEETTQLVVLHSLDNDRVMYVRLEPMDGGGDFYTVRTAFPARAGFAKNKVGWKVLWDGRAQPSTASGSQTPFADQPQSSGEAGTIPSGQSTERSVTPQEPGGNPASLTSRANAALAKTKGGPRITPDAAANMGPGDIIVDDRGQEYRAHRARGEFLEAHPIENGKANVSADTTVRFHLNPETAEAHPDRRADPVYATGRNINEPQAGKIEDVGEKIGGARKDLSTPTGQRTTKATSEQPGWRNRYSVAQIAKSSKPGEEGRWSITDKRQKDWMGQPKQIGTTFATKEEAEAAIPLLEVARNHRATPVSVQKGEHVYEIVRMVSDRKRVKVVDKQFPTREDAMRYMAEHAVEIIETKTSFGEEVLPAPDTVRREGPVRRQGDATADQFKDTFGFRAVEFGNWNSQEERQAVMNHAFDGLADLAEVLGIPTRAIGLNGELALAFGARGSGLTGARAHYERDYGVINLTKMHGAGSLAHEWMHALDHYLARQDTKASSERVKNERGDMVFKASTPTYDYASHGFRAVNSGVRNELRDAYTALMEAMYRKAEQYVEDTQKADRFVAKAREDVQKRLDQIRTYLANRREAYRKRNNDPASAEQLAAFDELARKIVDGEMLEMQLVTSESKSRSMAASMRWSNDALEGINKIIKAVRGHGGFDATTRDGTLDRLRGEINHYSQRLKMLADAQSAEVKTKKVPTEYAMAAKSIDQGRASDYWSTQHEMAARAFQSYVLDRIGERGGTSDFLTYGAENLVIPTPWGWQRPFPAGAERKAINAAFDKLVAVLQTKDTDRGVMLFSRRTDAAAHEAATSPFNDHPEPTKAQKDAGNYPKGHLRIAGLGISIENPAGTHRRPEWPALPAHYGYIRSLRVPRDGLVQSGVTQAEIARDLPQALTDGAQARNLHEVVDVLLARVRAHEAAASQSFRQRALRDTDRTGDGRATDAFAAEIQRLIKIPSERPRGHVHTLVEQAAADGVSADAYLFGDTGDALAIRSHGFDRIDIDRKAVVQRHMIGAIKDDEVRQAVIRLLSVDVVDMLGWAQWAPDSLLGDQTVLLERLANPAALDDAVSVRQLVDAVAARLPVAFAARVAKEARASGEAPTVTKKNGSAPRAGNVSHSGYVSTKGADGDHVDVFVREGTLEDFDGPVFVIDQNKANGSFDEHKVMLGWRTQVGAARAYRAAFTKGWKGLGAITRTTLDGFKAWLADGNTKRRFKAVDAAQRPVQDVPRGTVPQDHHDAVGRLQAALRGKAEGADAVRAIDGLKANAVPDRLAAGVARLERMFGIRIVFVEGAERLSKSQQFDGSYIGGRTLYVSSTATKPLHFVTGHEFLHHLKQTNRALYDEFVDRVRPYLLARRAQKYADERAAEYNDLAESVRAELGWEETFADSWGAAWHDPGFWQSMHAREPSLFKRIAAKWKMFVMRVRMALSGSGNAEEVRGLFTDFDAVRDIVADIAGRAVPAEAGAVEQRVVPVFSRKDDPAAFAADVLAELSEYDELYRSPVSKKVTLDGVMAEVFNRVEYLGEDTRADEKQESGADIRHVFRTDLGKNLYVFERGKDIWMDVSRLAEGEYGGRFYAGVLNYAHNTGKRLIGDPAGLSEAAVVRRTSAMLSSALRFGTTKHMDAAPEQRAGIPENGIAALKWGTNDVENVRAMIESFLSTLYTQFPALKGYRYDFAKHRFVDRRGRPLDAARLERGEGSPDARGARAGEATLRRGIFLQSLVSNSRSERPGLLEEVLSRGRSLVTDGDLGAMFSRRTDAAGPGIRFSRRTQAAQPPVSDPKVGPIDTLLRGAGGKLLSDKLLSPLWDRLTRAAGRVIPESVKQGLVSDYGLDEPYMDVRTATRAAINKQLRSAKSIIDMLAGLDREQSRVAYQWMTERPDAAAERAMMDALPEASRAVMQRMKAMVHELGRAAVRAGLLSEDSFERNEYAYLHRSYTKHEAESAGVDGVHWKARAKIRAETFKGRGLRHDIDQDRLLRYADEVNAGDKFVRFERRRADGKLAEVRYVPVGKPIPTELAEWQSDGVWEARWMGQPSATKVGMYRDFTKAERERMGEIEEVRYAFAKTVLHAVKDIEHARFLQWVAQTYGEDPEALEAAGTTVHDGKSGYIHLRTYAPDDWVQVPATKIPKTNLRAYGELAGRAVPAPIWNDIRSQFGSRPETMPGKVYDWTLRAWKASKTAMSPAVHTNNVMANVILADLADIRATDVVTAFRTLRAAKRGDPAAKALVARYEDSGAEQGSLIAQELRLEAIEPLLAELESEADQDLGLVKVSQLLSMAAHGDVAAALQGLKSKKALKAAALPFQKLIHAYRMEDSVFRLAAFIRYTTDGMNDIKAGQVARDTFLNYEINAPWINALRRGPLPFIAFSYRAIPMLMKAAVKKPWKIAKYAGTAAALNAAAYMMLGLGDDDERRERALLPEEKSGKVFGIFPRLMRMPWNDEHGSPVFLDVRRWLPAGDVFDVQQSQAAVPLPGWLTASGPLGLLMEMMLNKSSFTGNPIVLETDTTGEATAKVLSHVNAFMQPNLPIPNPLGWLADDEMAVPGIWQTYSWAAIEQAHRGATDAFRRERSMSQALLSSIGIKLASYPQDAARMHEVLKYKANESEIGRQINSINRQEARGGLDADEAAAKREAQQQKLKRINQRLLERLRAAD